MAALQLILVAANEQRQEEIRQLRFLRRRLRDTSNPFDVPENQFCQLYSKEYVYSLSREATRLLCEALRPHVENQIRGTAIPLELKVLTTLNFMASGSYQKQVGQDYLSSMCQASVSGVIHAIIEGLNALMGEWIIFPVQPRDLQDVKDQFWLNGGFPGVIGAVDGTHIAIWPPETVREHLYINRKLYHSLNVMLVSDYYGKILAVTANHGGRTHDSRVWSGSAVLAHLRNQHDNGRTGAWLLGDSGYPTLPYLMTPKLHQIPGTLSAAYTDAHVRSRCAIERCIGVLKGRWRCLRKERALHYTPEFAALIVNAACVLHNYAKFHNVANPAEFLDEIDRDNENLVPLENFAVDGPLRITGNEVRELIIRRHFTH